MLLVITGKGNFSGVWKLRLEWELGNQRSGGRQLQLSSREAGLKLERYGVATGSLGNGYMLMITRI